MKFVFWCSNEQRQFRLAELDSLIHMLGFQVSVEMNIKRHWRNWDVRSFNYLPLKVEWLVRSSSLPWVALNLSTEEEAKAILERCPMII